MLPTSPPDSCVDYSWKLILRQTMTSPIRIFVSYARRDAAQLASRLHADLQALGYEVWMDRARLSGGDRWRYEIHRMIEHSDAVLALVSDGAFTSDICRVEQSWALDSGKRVIPIRVQKQAQADSRLTELHWLDFSDALDYSRPFDALLQSLGEPAEARSLPEAHNNAPPLPERFVERPDLLASLREALFLESEQRNVGLTALEGMGGIGKTVLAQALCRDRVVRVRLSGRYLLVHDRPRVHAFIPPARRPHARAEGAAGSLPRRGRLHQPIPAGHASQGRIDRAG